MPRAPHAALLNHQLSRCQAASRCHSAAAARHSAAAWCWSRCPPARGIAGQAHSMRIARQGGRGTWAGACCGRHHGCAAQRQGGSGGWPGRAWGPAGVRGLCIQLGSSGGRASRRPLSPWQCPPDSPHLARGPTCQACSIKGGWGVGWGRWGLGPQTGGSRGM